MRENRLLLASLILRRGIHRVCVRASSLLRIMHSTPPSYGDEGGESYTLRCFLTNPGDAFGIFKNSFNVYFSTWLRRPSARVSAPACWSSHG